MSDIRWCFEHDERVPPRTEWCDIALQTMTRTRPVHCDVRDAVVLPKGEYYRKAEPESVITQRGWQCRNCGDDHGGEGCDDPEFDGVSYYQIVKVSDG